MTSSCSSEFILEDGFNHALIYYGIIEFEL